MSAPASLLARAAEHAGVSVAEVRQMAEQIVAEVPGCRFEVALTFLAGETPSKANMLKDTGMAVH